MAPSSARVLYWFRTDLRLHDSPALLKALELKPAAFFPLWCWDPSYIYGHRVGVNRLRFLLESMACVSASITALNARSQLLVVRGNPAELLPELLRRWQITHLVFEKDDNGYARTRDAAVREIAKDAGVELVDVDGHQLYPVSEVLKRAGGKAPMTMQSLQKAIAPLGEPARPLDAPGALPDAIVPGAKGAAKDRKALLTALRDTLDGMPHYSAKGPPDVDLNGPKQGGQRVKGEKVTVYDSLVGPDEDVENLFGVPTLESMGMDPEASGATKTAVVPGGEKAALKRLAFRCKDPAYFATFSKPKSSPALDTSEASTALLSPYLKFGAISCRRVWWDAHDAAQKYKGKHTPIPENFKGQQLFNLMYSVVESATGDAYQHVRGNEISRYMDWYLPTAYDKDGQVILPRPRGDEVSEERYEAFVQGRTGFPWIDALSRQLRATGWIHHLGRHSLACFLTRGQCWISWERGAEFFEELLLDWDPSANAGNWMWLSCSAFFHQYMRVYGLATFGQKYDKTGALIRQYCPELAKFDDKYIYSPHLAPMEAQKKAGCIIGQDYPAPILDEKEEKSNCIARCKAAFTAKLHGADKEVLAGKAEARLRKAHGIPDPKPSTAPKSAASKVPAWAKAKAEKEEPASTKKEEEEHLHEAAGGESATADKQPARPKRKAPAASASGSKGKRAKSEK